jgi:ankyrin repeat protein
MLEYLTQNCHVDVEAQDNDGCTALHRTAYTGRRVEVVQYLVQNCGANVEAKDDKGRTALHYCSEGHGSRLKMLLLNRRWQR